MWLCGLTLGVELIGCIEWLVWTQNWLTIYPLREIQVIYTILYSGGRRQDLAETSIWSLQTLPATCDVSHSTLGLKRPQFSPQLVAFNSCMKTQVGFILFLSQIIFQKSVQGVTVTLIQLNSICKLIIGKDFLLWLEYQNIWDLVCLSCLFP